MGRTKFAVFFFSVSLACAVPPLLAKKKEKPASSASDQRRALHALNRLTFGPRPGDVQRVMAMGVDQWIDLQLHPEKIDDSALEARLEPFRTTRMSTQEIAEEFPDGPRDQSGDEWQETHAVRRRAANGLPGSDRPSSRKRKKRSRRPPKTLLRLSTMPSDTNASCRSFRDESRARPANENCRRCRTLRTLQKMANAGSPARPSGEDDR